MHSKYTSIGDGQSIIEVSDYMDPVAKIPEFKVTAVKIEKEGRVVKTGKREGAGVS